MSVDIKVKKFSRMTSTENCDTSCSSCSWHQIAMTEAARQDLLNSDNPEIIAAQQERLMEAVERAQNIIKES